MPIRDILLVPFAPRLTITVRQARRPSPKSEEAPVVSSLGRKFKSRRPHSAGNAHALLRDPDRAFGTGRVTSTSSREEACEGADMNPVRNPDSVSGVGTVAGG